MIKVAIPIRTRPNCFVAIRVSQFPQVTAAIKTVQNSLVQYASQLNGALVDPATAHLTLMVMTLQQNKELNQALEEGEKSMPGVHWR